jgi:hypothetical protein
MKLLLPVVFLFSPFVQAQMYTPILKTNLNKFILDKDIEWAIYKNDSLITGKPNLKSILIQKAISNKIKAFRYSEQGTSQENNLEYYSKADAQNLNYSQDLSQPQYREDGKYEIDKPRKLNLTEPIGQVNVTQILYTKNGKLFSDINRVSPLFNLVTAQGLELGKAELFSTALNTKQTNFNSKTDKIIYLTTTTKDLYVDSVKKEDKLKETFGNNLIETLWPYIETNKIKIHLLPYNKQTTLKAINTNNLLNLQSINVPLYDSLGDHTGSKNIFEHLTPNIFDKITITQVWYYNDTKNIVFCKIPSAILTVKKYPNNDFMNNTVRQIKLVF